MAKRIVGRIQQTAIHLISFLGHIKNIHRSEASDHLVVALALATTLLFLEHHHLLGWADAIMLRLNSVAVGQDYRESTSICTAARREFMNDATLQSERSSDASKSTFARGSPVAEVAWQYSPTKPLLNEHPLFIIDIDSSFYEQVFHARSPLDRSVMADFLQQVIDAKPREVVIDVDLSPIPGDDHGQNRLNDLLVQAGASLCSRNDKKPCGLVLLEPIWYKSEKFRLEQAKWFNGMCNQKGIYFGDGDLISNFSFDVRYYDLPHTLANVASTPTINNLCSVPASTLYAEQEDKGDNCPTKPYNALGYELLKANTLKASEVFLNRNLKDYARRLLRDSVIFIGGSYGLDDKHDFAGNDVYGVLLHALAYYSEHNPVRETEDHTAAFILDIILGFCLGVLFKFSWHKYNTCRIQYAHSRLGLLSRLRGYMKMEAMLLINLAMILAIIVVTTLASKIIYTSGFWLNPAPLMIGMFVHSLLESKEDIKISEGTHHNPHTVDIRKMVLLFASLIISFRVLT